MCILEGEQSIEFFHVSVMSDIQFIVQRLLSNARQLVITLWLRRLYARAAAASSYIYHQPSLLALVHHLLVNKASGTHH